MNKVGQLNSIPTRVSCGEGKEPKKLNRKWSVGLGLPKKGENSCKNVKKVPLYMLNCVPNYHMHMLNYPSPSITILYLDYTIHPFLGLYNIVGFILS